MVEWYGFHVFPQEHFASIGRESVFGKIFAAKERKEHIDKNLHRLFSL